MEDSFKVREDDIENWPNRNINCFKQQNFERIQNLFDRLIISYISSLYMFTVHFLTMVNIQIDSHSVWAIMVFNYALKWLTFGIPSGFIFSITDASSYRNLGHEHQHNISTDIL